MLRPLRPLTLAVVLLAVAASPAWATRYAVATGGATTGPCDQGHPCTLNVAIGGGSTAPATGEEIVVEPGSYTVSSFITADAANLDIHGIEGQPAPVINGVGNVVLYTGAGKPGIKLTHLDFESSMLSLQDPYLDRVILRGNAGGNVLCQCYSGPPQLATIRDSLVVVTGGVGGVGVASNGGNANIALRNDTVVSTAAGTPAIALLQQDTMSGNTGDLELAATNTIAVNTAGGTAILAQRKVATQTTAVTLDHSDFGVTSGTGGGTVTSSATAGNTSAGPMFSPTTPADFRLVAGSPAIDHGLADPLNGALDLDGDLRTAGTAIDMGAYEFGSSPPPVPPAPAPVILPPAAPVIPILTPTPTPKPAAPKLALLSRTVTAARATGKGTLSARCSGSTAARCTVTGTLTARLPHHTKAAKVGSVAGTIARGKTGKLTVKLTSAALTALLAKGHLSATAALTATANGAHAKRSLRLTIKPAVATRRRPKQGHA